MNFVYNPEVIDFIPSGGPIWVPAPASVRVPAPASVRAPAPASVRVRAPMRVRTRTPASARVSTPTPVIDPVLPSRQEAEAESSADAKDEFNFMERSKLNEGEYPVEDLKIVGEKQPTMGSKIVEERIALYRSLQYLLRWLRIPISDIDDYSIDVENIDATEYQAKFGYSQLRYQYTLKKQTQVIAKFGLVFGTGEERFGCISRIE